MDKREDIEKTLQSIWDGLPFVLGDGQAEKIKTLEFETGLDSTGDEAVWIWFYLENTVEAREDGTNDKLRLLVKDKFREAGLESWPYLHVRGTTKEEYSYKRSDHVFIERQR